MLFNNEPSKYYELWVNVVEHKREIELMGLDGIPVKKMLFECRWVKVPSCNLGSLNIPNEDILEVKWKPLTDEKGKTK